MIRAAHHAALLAVLLLSSPGPVRAAPASEDELASLVQTLAEGSEGERNRAAFRLKHLGDPRSVPRVLELLGAAATDRRATACWVLGLLGDVKARDPLIKALADPAPAVRAEAARALGILGGSKSGRALIRVLGDERDEVRLAATWALAEIPTPRAARPLLRLLPTEDTALKVAAIHALGATGSPSAVGPLTKLLADPSDAVQLAAALALSRLRSMVGGAALLGRLRDTENTDRRLAAVRGLRRVPGSWAVRQLTRALEDAELQVELAAARELARRGVDAGIDALLRLLDHENPTVREEADAALLTVGLADSERAKRLALIRGEDPSQPRPFYVQNEVEIDRLVRELFTRERSVARRIDRISQHFLHTRYRRDPLGEGEAAAEDPDPLLRFDAVDCLTFVEEAIALAVSPDLATAEQRLQHIRYAKGRVDYSQRNHFTMSQWIPNNTRLGLLEDVTRKVAGKKTRITLKLLDERAWSTPSGRRWRQRLGPEALPEGDFDLPIVSVKDLLTLGHKIPTGTVLSVVKTDRAEYPHRISHVALVVSHRGKLYVRHAAERFYHRVVDSPLSDYLKRIERYQKWPVEGINLQRVKNPWPVRRRAPAPRPRKAGSH